MNNPIGQYSLEEVLDAYFAAAEKPSRELLAEWVSRFPQFADQLADFTVAWIQTEHFPEDHNRSMDSQKQIQIGIEMAHKVYHQRTAENNKSVNSQLDSVLKAGARIGLSPDQLKDEFNISMVILRKIENRFFQVETIPSALIQQMAQTIHHNPEELRIYLKQSPMVPPELRMKSREAPKINEKENFFEAIRADNSLTENQRIYWLSVEGTK